MTQSGLCIFVFVYSFKSHAKKWKKCQKNNMDNNESRDTLSESARHTAHGSFTKKEWMKNLVMIKLFRINRLPLCFTQLFTKTNTEITLNVQTNYYSFKQSPLAFKFTTIGIQGSNVFSNFFFVLRVRLQRGWRQFSRDGARAKLGFLKRGWVSVSE